MKQPKMICPVCKREVAITMTANATGPVAIPRRHKCTPAEVKE